MTDLEKAIDRFDLAIRQLVLLNTVHTTEENLLKAEREKTAARQKLLRIATRNG